MDGETRESLSLLSDLFRADAPIEANFRGAEGLRDAARERVKLGEHAHSAYDEYHRALEACTTLLHAANASSWDTPTKQLKSWRHQEYVPLPKDKKAREPFISQPDVDEAISIYLSTKLRCDYLDRMLMDASIGGEMFEFFDHPQAKLQSRKLRELLLDWALVAALLYFSSGAWWAWIIACAVLLYPIVIYVLSRNARRKRAILVASMMAAYQGLGGSLVSTKELRRLLEAARDAGAVWPSSAWVLLEDIESRRSSL